MNSRGLARAVAASMVLDQEVSKEPACRVLRKKVD